MRFMTMVKGPEGVQPPPELFVALDKLGREAAQAGVMFDTGGLMPTAHSTEIRLTGGKISVTDGPFSEAKEVVGGYAIFEVESKEQALEWAVRFMELHRDLWPGWDGATDLRQIFGGVDYGAEASGA
ncbi:MAG TPA: YciI family protein [Kribbellaceae bacterium]|nr:YciI family protein [Kribbellaceae bacterium]